MTKTKRERILERALEMAAQHITHITEKEEYCSGFCPIWKRKCYAKQGICFEVIQEYFVDKATSESKAKGGK